MSAARLLIVSAFLLLAALLTNAAFLSPTTLGATQQSQPPAERPCEQDVAWQKLDFWLGEWDVYVGERKVGTNRIEKTLRGCALLEHWTSGFGRQGKSLFYYNPVAREWKQVWVTDSGAVKEKTLTAEFDDGGVRFQGELPQPDGGVILDRTTLTPLEGGRVRQVIEQSSDNGRSWKVGFDAIYRPRTIGAVP